VIRQRIDALLQLRCVAIRHGQSGIRGLLKATEMNISATVIRIADIGTTDFLSRQDNESIRDIIGFIVKIVIRNTDKIIMIVCVYP
jgi:hypothetical protein